MERIESAVQRELGRFGPAGSIAALVEAWPGAVGESIARNAWPARVARDGTLHVATSSAAWSFELTQLAPTILERLQAAVTEPPTSLRFAPGPLPEPSPTESERAGTAPSPPSPEAVAEAEELAASIHDEELRKLVAKAAAASLSRPPDDRSF